ncbi:MAG: hypothetical protein KDJ88_01270 [Bauldia sp.]|nr:hypothetical protein [Bauldia sp.]
MIIHRLVRFDRLRVLIFCSSAICSFPTSAISASQSFPADLIGSYGGIGYSCHVEIRNDLMIGLFDGGGTCALKSLRMVTDPDNPVEKGWQGKFSCGFEGTKWDTEIAVSLFPKTKSHETYLVTVLNVDGSDPAAVFLWRRCE